MFSFSVHASVVSGLTIPHRPSSSSVVFGLSPSSYGLITLIAATGFIMGNLGAGYIVRNRPSQRIFYAGEVILLVGALGMFCMPREMVTAATVLGMTFLFTVGFGIIFPIATKEALGCYVAQAGAAAALIGFFQLGGSALSSLAVGFLQPRASLLTVPWRSSCFYSSLLRLPTFIVYDDSDILYNMEALKFLRGARTGVTTSILLSV